MTDLNALFALLDLCDQPTLAAVKGYVDAKLGLIGDPKKGARTTGGRKPRSRSRKGRSKERAGSKGNSGSVDKLTKALEQERQVSAKWRLEAQKSSRVTGSAGPTTSSPTLVSNSTQAGVVTTVLSVGVNPPAVPVTSVAPQTAATTTVTTRRGGQVGGPLPVRKRDGIVRYDPARKPNDYGTFATPKYMGPGLLIDDKTIAVTNQSSTSAKTTKLAQRNKASEALRAAMTRVANGCNLPNPLVSALAFAQERNSPKDEILRICKDPELIQKSPVQDLVIAGCIFYNILRLDAIEQQTATDLRGEEWDQLDTQLAADTFAVDLIPPRWRPELIEYKTT